MNNALMKYKLDIKNKKVAVLGIGISNRPLIKYLVRLGVKVAAFDKCTKEALGDFAAELNDMGVETSLGEKYLDNLDGFDVIFRTPGMRYDLPQLLEAKKRGAEITSEMEVFMSLCPAKIFAITGSDGKTTTTSLVYELLQQQGYKCWLGGNIGLPLLSKIDEIMPKDFVVLELSSFQLHTMKNSPQVAAITNISPNHLDVHKSMEEYVDAKKNIFEYQFVNDTLVLNDDNDITKSFLSEARGKVILFSRINSLKEGLYVLDGYITARFGLEEKKLLKCEDILIPGKHNIENYLAAIAMTYEYVNVETINHVAQTFKEVEHRGEFIREFEGVRYYNSSIDSSPNRTRAAVETFSKKVILIAGGKDKGIQYDELGPVILDNVKALILIGATADKIQNALEKACILKGEKTDIVPVHKCETYEEIVKTAKEIATPGDIVILSPASTSFDMFKNFEERGNLFKKLVLDLR